MRPHSIVVFEQIYLISLLIGILNVAMEWENYTALTSPNFSLTVMAITLSFSIFIVLLISRKRSVVAKWILILTTAAGLPLYTKLLQFDLLSIGEISTLAPLLLQFLALALLFTPSARDWLAGSSA